MSYATDALFPLVREPASRWERTGLNPEQERWFNLATTMLVLLFGIGWIVSVVERADSPTASAARPPLIAGDRPRTGDEPESAPTLADRLIPGLGREAAPIAPRINDALLTRAATQYAALLPQEVRGLSGALYVQIVPPGQKPILPDVEGASVRLDAGSSGVANLILEGGGLTRRVPNLRVVRMVPMSRKVNGRVGDYRIGSWPCETGDCPANPIYRTPPGLIELTPQNREMFISKHIKLRHFQTKLQEGVWPKYVVVNPKVVDKVELVIKELEAMGHPVDNIFAVSGFRSPWYNANGGNTGGRGRLSRHMYGDAMDLAIDNDRNGIMDDLNGDGSINLADARLIGQAVDRVERKYPSMVGGMHYYPPTGGHRGMVHIDTRGNRARW